MTLRNPSDQPQDFTASLSAMLELPEGSAATFTAHSPWKDDRASATVNIPAQASHTYHLLPFQVLTLELTAER